MPNLFRDVLEYAPLLNADPATRSEAELSARIERLQGVMARHFEADDAAAILPLRLAGRR